ncbi:hypothetical protein E2C00_17860 [Streptomyces sp. WAC05374]|uniref:hypothetical protein n=1 Tax=Streptomyces sp. WAC05374 TaxID=2487420 RepID=UPI000F888584|nr:hypothetical protein [Streptomyces sp. WAC05374]RST17670.1 hypothetical protein EF905_08775 [Streptomyces sp. WAC05374]TDF54755.1 hypothetical protein E2C00_17860 [Streptomyces sp. WAC05374]TDF56391.1 hypothetical protein E2C02_13315 [Streptomyces sp. WAC05374]
MDGGSVNSHVREHAERYATVYEGRHPYSDCWQAAWGVAAWAYEEGNAEQLVAAIAEAMRLAMARDDVTVARLHIGSARDELWHWVGDALHGPGPVPGSLLWPMPTGPHAASWQRHFADAGTDEVRHMAGQVEDVLTALLRRTAERFPHAPATFGTALGQQENPVTGSMFFRLA